MTTTTRSRKATTQKIVQIIARIQFQNDSRKVCYQVRSSNGNDVYITCLFNGRACSCTCPAMKPCYHMTQLEAIEAARITPVAKTALRVREEWDETPASYSLVDARCNRDMMYDPRFN